MTYIKKLHKWETLVTLLKIGIGSAGAQEEEIVPLRNFSMSQWKEIWELAMCQGVDAIVFDGVQKIYQLHKKDLVAIQESLSEWLDWLMEGTDSMTYFVQQNVKQKDVISRLSEIWGEQGILMMVFKGQANAALYPIPGHRPTGDIDCYLFGEAEKGDRILQDLGAEVSFNWYRHSKITFDGETIENHRVFGHTRGSKKLTAMEKELIAMLSPLAMAPIAGCGRALMPPAQFNACFLTYHALRHFLAEGLRIRQILDWAVFLQREQDHVDWPAFNDFCRRYGLDRFAAVMNYMAVKDLGVSVAQADSLMDGTYAERVWQGILHNDEGFFNSGKGDWTVRWLLVRNMLTRDRWKYRDIANRNAVGVLWRQVMGFFFDRD